MAKTVFKEIIIMLLLCLAIIIILGLLLYDYVPMSKVVPEPVSYITPEQVQKELKEAESIDESQVIMTYEVNASDLSNYKNINKYNPGKANPFSSYETSTDNKQTTSTNNGSSTGATSSNNQSNNSGGTSNEITTTSEGQFFQDKGTK